MNYNDNGTIKKIAVKAGDTLPIGTIVEIQGSTVPDGYSKVDDLSLEGVNEKVGELYNLTTTDKSNVVNSINEVNDKFNYSTEETKIGTWIDGKPVYRKVVQNIVPTGLGINIYTMNDIENVVDYYGIYHQNNGFEKRINFYFSATDYMTLNFNRKNHQFLLDNTSNYNNNGTVSLIIEYTKKTD